MNQLPQTQAQTQLTLKTRKEELHAFFKQGPQSHFDLPIEIFTDNEWVPCFFSRLNFREFFLYLSHRAFVNPGDGKCFVALSNVKTSYTKEGIKQFMIQGLEIQQAPKIETVLTPALPYDGITIDLPPSDIKLIKD